MSLLRFDRLTARFGYADVLADVSLEVAAGETVALLGRSGSGKTTLASAALGLLGPEASVTGRVLIDGADLAIADPVAVRGVRGGRIGLIFQEPASALDPVQPIGRQIAEAVRAHRRLRGRALGVEVRRLLDEVGLDAPAGRYPHMLSGGQRQRAAIAIALAGGPALLIADEPTAALDPLARAEIMALFRRLVRERGLGLLLISHHLPLVAALANRVVVLDRGRIVEHGPALMALADPASPALRAAIGAGQDDGSLPPAPAAATPLLATEALGRSFTTGGWWRRRRVPVLADVDLAIGRGETLALVGASGSGKSTLARLVLGLDRPSAGRVLIDGRDRARARGADARALRAAAQAVFQDPAESLDPAMPIGRSVAEPLALAAERLPPAEMEARVAEALALVGLDAGVAARLPHAFSGGQRQRIALARALVLRPPLIVLDEALSALDPELREEMATLLLRLQRELGLAYLFIAHDLALVRRLAHRVAVLRDGRVVEQGPTSELLARPRDPYTAALVAASPTLEQALSRRGSPPSGPTAPALPPR